VGPLDEGRDPERPVRDQALTTVDADGPANGRITRRAPLRGDRHSRPETKGVDSATPAPLDAPILADRPCLGRACRTRRLCIRHALDAADESGADLREDGQPACDAAPPRAYQARKHRARDIVQLKVLNDGRREGGGIAWLVRYTPPEGKLIKIIVTALSDEHVLNRAGGLVTEQRQSP